MGLSPHLLIKSTFNGGGGSGSSAAGRRSVSPASSTRSVGSANGSTSLRHQTAPSPIAQHSYSSLFCSSSFSSTHTNDSVGSVASLNNNREKSAPEILRMVAERKLCVVQKSGAQDNTLVTSIVDSVCKAAGCAPAVYLNVNQRTAHQLLEGVQRNGLPLIFVNGNAVGGLSELRALEKSGFIADALRTHAYDLAVIGGGVGGLSAAKEASRLGKKVICIDSSTANARGTHWHGRLGGASVNGGGGTVAMRCAIECAQMLEKASEKDFKRSVYIASDLLETLDDFALEIVPEDDDKSRRSGGSGAKVVLNWQKLTALIDRKILETNEKCKQEMDEAQVECINATARFIGWHSVEAVDAVTGKTRTIEADKIILAIGQRPSYPSCVEGAERLGITADDLFTRPHLPGRTLCVGGDMLTLRLLEHVALLSGLGADVVVLTRFTDPDASVDQRMAQRIQRYLTARGVEFIAGTPSRFIESSSFAENSPATLPRILCEYVSTDQSSSSSSALRTGGAMSNESAAKQHYQREFNTVLLMCGDRPPLDALDVCRFGLQTSGRSGRIATRPSGQCVGQMPNVYAVGACGAPQNDFDAAWTIGATRAAARTLIQHLYAGYLELETMTNHIPVTVTLPRLQYAYCGLTEELALKRYGVNNVSVYETTASSAACSRSTNINSSLEEDASTPAAEHAAFRQQRAMDEALCCKLICNKSEQNSLLGIHIIARNAAEVVCGAAAVALKMGAKKSDVDHLLSDFDSITCNEIFTNASSFVERVKIS